MAVNACYDHAEAVARLGGDEALFASVAGLFVSDSANYCRALEEALAAGDRNALRREAHTVKSMLATFSCEDGRLLAFQLEQLAASGSLEGAEALTADLVASIRQLALALAANAA